MNKLEDICVSLEVAKRLHEAGIVVDSFARWVIVSQKITYNPALHDVYCLMNATDAFYKTNDRLGGSSIPAPTAEESWILLPQYIEINNEIYYLSQEGGNAQGFTLIRYMSLDNTILVEFSSDRVSDITTEMLIWLKQSAKSEGEDE